jgi:uncharacterized membrane protein YfcA
MDLVAVAAFALLASVAQALFGFGFALVLVPLAAFVVDPRTAVATSIVLSAIVALGVYAELRPREPLGRVVPLAVAALSGFPLGLALLIRMDETALRILVGVAVAAGAAVNLRRAGAPHPERPNRVPLMVVVGLLAGLLSGTTSMGGPPVVLYQHWVGGGPDAIRRRLFAYFALMGVATIPLALASGVLTLDVTGYVLAGLPAIAVGIVLGRGLRPHLSERWFRRLSMALLAVTASTAVIGAAVAIL